MQSPDAEDDAELGLTSAPITATNLELRRVGHRPVQIPGLSDGPARPHAYFSVVAFDSGEVVPLNVWYHPQLFTFHPSSGALESRAFLYPHQNTGNEDAIRWRIRAHKGATAADSLFLWTVKSYEEVTSENGTLGKDAAVLSSRPLENSPGVLPLAVSRTLNMGADASNPNIGPGIAGLDYDQTNNLVFLSMDRTDISATRDVFQILKLNTSTGAFEGRVRVPKPGTAALQEYTFIRVDPAHRIVMLQADNYWEPQKDLLYLAQYTPTGTQTVATVQNFQQLGNFFLPGHQGDINYMPTQSSDAVFAERAGRLYAILGGNGLYLFDLGPVGGPYTLAPPIGKMPLAFPLEYMKIVDDNLFVSAHGIEVYSLGAVLDVRGEQTLPKQVYRLPYKTYDFDMATIAGDLYLFLAAGQYGIDSFRLTNNGTGLMTGAMNAAPRAVQLNRGPGAIRLESGDGLRYLGAPAMNANGDMALWGVTDNQREVIVRVSADQSVQIIADTSTGMYTSFSRPSINDAGQIAFHAAKPDGGEAIVLYSGSLAEVVTQAAGTGFLQIPEIANNGDIVFAKGPLPSGAKQLQVRKASGQIMTVFTENSSYDLSGGSDYASLQGDYDIAPNGSVAFGRFARSGGNGRLTLWNGSSLTDIATDAPRMHYVRFNTNGFVTSTTCNSDILRLRRTTTTSTSKSLADRRTMYQGYLFGNFNHAASISAGDTVFAAPKFVIPTMDRKNTGHALHYYREASPNLPDIILQTTAVVDARTVRNVDFVDAFNEAGEVAFTTELEGANGDYRFAVIQYGGSLPANSSLAE